MTRTPRAAGLIFCKRMDIDLAAREMLLRGIFPALFFPSLPSATFPFTVYTVLQNGEGEGKMTLRGLRLETEQQIYVRERWFVWPQGMGTTQLEIPIERIVFPASGRYLFSLAFDGDDAAERFLDVMWERGQP